MKVKYIKYVAPLGIPVNEEYSGIDYYSGTPTEGMTVTRGEPDKHSWADLIRYGVYVFKNGKLQRFNSKEEWIAQGFGSSSTMKPVTTEFVKKYFGNTDIGFPTEIRNNKLTELVQKLRLEGILGLELNFSRDGSVINEPYINDKLSGKIISEQIPIIEQMISGHKQVAKDILAQRAASNNSPGGTADNRDTGGTGGTGGGAGGTTETEEKEEKTADDKKILGMTYTQAGMYGGVAAVFIVLGIIFGPKLFKKIAGTSATN